MLKIVYFKSLTLVFLGSRLYSTLPSTNYQSFIVMRGVKYFETKREVLRSIGFKEFPVKSRRIRLTSKSTSRTCLSMCA
jgi:hypothetical protein